VDHESWTEACPGWLDVDEVTLPRLATKSTSWSSNNGIETTAKAKADPCKLAIALFETTPSTRHHESSLPASSHRLTSYSPTAGKGPISGKPAVSE
jgi:hypothetical protein